MFSVFRELRIPFKATIIPQHFLGVSSLHMHLFLSIPWISRWRGLSHGPKNGVWPKNKLGQVTPEKRKPPDLQVPLQTINDTKWGRASLGAAKPVNPAQGRSCLRLSQLQGTGWSKIVSPLFPSLLGWLHYEHRIGCSIPGPQQNCHVSSGVHSPSGPWFWWPCFKEQVMWKWEAHFG